MKKILAVSAVAVLGLSSAVMAGGLPETMPMAAPATSSDMGVYVGLSGGYGMTNWKNLDKETLKVSKDNAFVGRAFVGADLCRYFAVEFGYSHFVNKPEVGTDKYKNTMALDLMGKLKAPVVDNFDLYAKLGMDLLMSRVSEGTAKNATHFNVAYGAGADYAITPNIIANVEWLRFNGKAKVSDSKYQPATDAFLVGVRYRFDI